LPRAPLAPGEPAREPEQADPEGQRERPREVGDPLGEEALDDLASPRRLRRRRRDDRHQPGERGRDRQQLRRQPQAYSLTRTRRSSSSLPGSRIASTESPGTSCIVSSGIDALPLRTTEITRDPGGSCTCRMVFPAQLDLSSTVTSTISRFSFFSSRSWISPCSGPSCSIRALVDRVGDPV